MGTPGLQELDMCQGWAGLTAWAWLVMGKPSTSTSLPATVSTLLSLPADLSAAQTMWQNMAPVAYGLSSSHLHRDSSFWVSIPKSQGRFPIGLACTRCPPLNQSTAAREGSFTSMVDSAGTM